MTGVLEELGGSTSDPPKTEGAASERGAPGCGQRDLVLTPPDLDIGPAELMEQGGDPALFCAPLERGRAVDVDGHGLRPPDPDLTTERDLEMGPAPGRLRLTTAHRQAVETAPHDDRATGDHFHARRLEGRGEPDLSGPGGAQVRRRRVQRGRDEAHEERGGEERDRSHRQRRVRDLVTGADGQVAAAPPLSTSLFAAFEALWSDPGRCATTGPRPTRDATSIALGAVESARTPRVPGRRNDAACADPARNPAT